jgi:hypothetical protein
MARSRASLVALLEPADHLRDAEAALHFELAVVPSRRADHRFADVRAEDVDGPAAHFTGSSANSMASE